MVILPALLSELHSACAGFPDKRQGGDVTNTMSDIGLSAFSLFFMQSESFLSHQRSLAEGEQSSNCHTLFGMQRISDRSYTDLDAFYRQDLLDRCKRRGDDIWRFIGIR